MSTAINQIIQTPMHFFFLLLLLLLPLFSVSDPNTAGCSSSQYECGSRTFDIHYPFRLQSSPAHCGHPEFNLYCDKYAESLFIYIDDKGYQVNNISYPDKLLQLTDTSLLTNQTCPLPSSNVSFNSSLYDYSAFDTSLTFYFNCTRSLPGLRNVSCSGNEPGYLSYYWFTNDSLPARRQCKSVVVVPLLNETRTRELTAVGEETDLVAAMKEGFGLTWKVDGWCGKCEDSNGVCGNDPYTGESACLCSINAANINGICQPFKKSSHTGTIIGIVAGVAGALIIGCCLFLFYRRRKIQKQASLTTLLSRNTSSKLSSKKDLELGDNNYNTHIFTYDELVEATNGFDASRELGDGGFGTVYKGKLRDGRTVAVKRLYENNYRRLEQFMNEIEILSRLRHQNLVTLYGCTSRHSRELLLVYEYIPNGTLADHIHGPLASNGPLSWPTRMSIAIEAADALAYLHAVEPQIIHRDVKTNNILLDINFHVKVADFGLSRLFPLDATHVSTAPQGTPGYVDPEYHQCYQLTDKSDVYSFGVVLVELISSKPAVDISRHRHEINLSNLAITKIQNRQIDQLVDPELGYHSQLEIKSKIDQVAELAFMCLQSDRDMRPSIKEVLGTLRGIEGGSFKAEREVEAREVLMKEESHLLKNKLPFSPDSVAERWSSTSTTSNTST